MITEYQAIFRSLNSPNGEYVDYVRHTVKADSDANATAQIRTMIADLKRRHDIEFMARVEVLSQFDAVKFEVWPLGHANAADSDADTTATAEQLKADKAEADVLFNKAETDVAEQLKAEAEQLKAVKAEYTSIELSLLATADKSEADAESLRADAADYDIDAKSLRADVAERKAGRKRAAERLAAHMARKTDQQADAEQADFEAATADAEQVDKMEAEAEDSDFDQAEADAANPESRPEPFNVWGFADNRADSCKHKGARVPMVSIYRSTDNAWHPESVAMSPRQARQIAAAMVKAADAAERGTHKFEQEII